MIEVGSDGSGTYRDQSASTDASVHFDSDQLRPEADATIADMAETLISTGRSIEVRGHTDAVGEDE